MSLEPVLWLISHELVARVGACSLSFELRACVLSRESPKKFIWARELQATSYQAAAGSRSQGPGSGKSGTLHMNWGL